ncbi:outer membrane protein assembly factor BamE [Eionea flava]
MKIFSSATTLAVVLLLSACSSLLPGSYRIDIPQGNLITEEKVESISLGMNRRQVQRILGSPLLVDTFNQNRWDYFYSVDTSEGTSIEHHITIVFSDEVVSEIIEHSN